MEQRRFIVCALVGSFLSLFLAEVCFARIFFWTDEDGVKHFSNTHAPLGISVKQFHEQVSDSIQSSSGNSLFRVVKIYDGDTILVKKDDVAFPVRLVAIDAPEISHDKHGKSQPYGQKAKSYLASLIKGKNVRLVSYGVGGFNRVLAEVFVGKTNLNLVMIKAGLAEVYQGKKPEKLKSELYYQAQKQAQRFRNGMWKQGKNYVSPKTWRKKYPLR